MSKSPEIEVALPDPPPTLKAIDTEQQTAPEDADKTDGEKATKRT